MPRQKRVQRTALGCTIEDLGISNQRATFTSNQNIALRDYIANDPAFRDHVKTYGKATATNLVPFDLLDVQILLECDGLQGRLNNIGQPVLLFLDQKIRSKLAREWGTLSSKGFSKPSTRSASRSISVARSWDRDRRSRERSLTIGSDRDTDYDDRSHPTIINQFFDSRSTTPTPEPSSSTRRAKSSQRRQPSVQPRTPPSRTQHTPKPRSRPSSTSRQSKRPPVIEISSDEEDEDEEDDETEDETEDDFESGDENESETDELDEYPDCNISNPYLKRDTSFSSQPSHRNPRPSGSRNPSDAVADNDQSDIEMEDEDEGEDELEDERRERMREKIERELKEVMAIRRAWEDERASVEKSEKQVKENEIRERRARRSCRVGDNGGVRFDDNRRGKGAKG